VTAPYSRTYCGGGVLATCRSQLRASLAAATARVLAEQEVSDVSALTYDKSEDFIRSVTAGLVGVRPIDWQNRPTFQQVVGFSTHRPRGGAAPPARPAAPVAGGQLPATGAGVPAIGALLVLLVVGLLRLRRAH
jgi:hypothetical protein